MISSTCITIRTPVARGTVTVLRLVEDSTGEVEVEAEEAGEPEEEAECQVVVEGVTGADGRPSRANSCWSWKRNSTARSICL